MCVRLGAGSRNLHSNGKEQLPFLLVRVLPYLISCIILIAYCKRLLVSTRKRYIVLLTERTLVLFWRLMTVPWASLVSISGPGADLICPLGPVNNGTIFR